MEYKKKHNRSSWNPPTQAKKSQFAPRPFTVQRQAKAEITSLQRQEALEEEEPLQGKFATEVMPTQHNQGRTSTIIQMAGHAEDLCVLRNWIVKRADKTEINEYQKDKLPSTKPKFHGPYYSPKKVIKYFEEESEDVSEEQKKKIRLMAEPMSVGGKGFIILKNVTAGMESAEMRDLKMGKYTADADDQERHGVTGLRKYIKMSRHWLMDKQSQSHKRGFRDEDQWKVTWTGDNLVNLKKMLFKANPKALLNIGKDLKKLLKWLNETDVVYVGMSVLVVVAKNEGKAVPIDFEHPISKSEKTFYKHQKGIIEGVKNLHKLFTR